MESNYEKPLKIVGKIQNYEWGTKNEGAYIPKFLGISPEFNIPYAEYWIGVHPKAPSEVIIDDRKISLLDFIKENPKEILGSRIADKFNNRLPYLLKILSINQALSIQAHPHKKLARTLHDEDPENYPDENHKPEIAIAIDRLKALVGLKQFSEIIDSIDLNYEIKGLLSEDLVEKLYNENSDHESIIRELYSQIMNSSYDDLEVCISSIRDRLYKKNNHSDSEEQFLEQYKHYGIDVGLISILLFNIVNLERGQAIFTPAGIPHAYLKGNIVECMANSDNVVRAGLTPKFKDIATLTKMLETDSTGSTVDIREKEDRIIYKTSAEEFEIEILKPDKPLYVKNNSDINILLLLEGGITINWNNKIEEFNKGDAILLPACLKEYTISQNSHSYLISVRVP